MYLSLNSSFTVDCFDITIQNHDRQSGRLFVVSGSTGQPIGETYLEMPNSRETYMTPVLYHPPKGSSIILFGSGGETISGMFDT